MDYEQIRYELNEGVALVTLNRPEKLNAMTAQMGAEMADAIRAGRTPRLGARYCLHNTEVVLAIQGALETAGAYAVSSSFEPVEPMAYAGV